MATISTSRDPLTDHASTGLNLKILSRRFWPVSGPLELSLCDLANALVDEGHQVEAVTVRWSKRWPKRFRFQNFDVRTIHRPTGGPWGIYRYLRHLTRDLSLDRPDGVILTELGEESIAVDRQLGDATPFVFHLLTPPFAIDTGESEFSPKQVQALRHAAGIFVDSRWTADRISRLTGIHNDRIDVMPPGIAIASQTRRGQSQQNVARRAFQNAHPMLTVEPGQPLAVCATALFDFRGMLDLIQAWKRTVRRHPGARLWVIGDGAHARGFWDEIVHQKLDHTLILPGQFDDLEDLFQAANVYVHPLRTPVGCSQLTRAMAAGLCPIVTDAGIESLGLGDRFPGYRVPNADPESLSAAMLDCFNSPETSESLGQAAAQFAAQTYAIQSRLTQLVDPILRSHR